jgi:hypothetical protein
MIDVLKNLIEEKISRPVKTRGDCELISNAITETLDVDISYSTIKRFYGLSPSTKPNKKTLNTLAQFVGYKNYPHFIQTCAHQEQIDLYQIVYKAVYSKDDQAIINLVIKTKKSSELFINFIISLIRELLHNKNYLLIDRIFKLDALNFNSFTYSEALQLGNSIGLLLRKKPTINYQLLSNTNFIECVYLTFVDYSSLNGYYGEQTEIINRNQTEKKITLFTSAILDYRDFLNQKPITKIKVDSIYSKQLNPILCSRLLALKIMVNDTDNYSEMLDNYFIVHSKKFQLIDYSYELFNTAILTKDFILMKYLIEKINPDTSIEFYYQKYHLNSFYLMCMFYFKHSKNSYEQKKYTRLFNASDSTYGYEEFITIIHKVYLFGTAINSNKKDQIKKEYTKLSNQLNYPYFSEDFLLDYFK